MRFHANREGFVLPAAIFTIVILGLMAVTALTTANQEHRSSRAMRESGAAMYAAEAGANLLIATVVDSPRTQLDTLAANLAVGDSADLGWTTLPGGASYRGVFHRYDDGSGRNIFGITVTGRGGGSWGGEQIINAYLTPASNPAGLITSAIRGGVGGAAAEIRDPPGVSGLDVNPGVWGAACTQPLQDKPGIEWGNNDVDYDPGDLLGDPPLVVDPTIDPSNLFVLNGFTFDELAAMANITLTGDPGQIEPKVAGPNCNTSFQTNWGAPESGSAHPCYDYFPIIHRAGDLRIRDANSVGQGILLVSGDLRIEDSFRFYGIIIVKGDIRFEDGGTQIMGGVIAGGIDRVRDGAGVQYSSCVADRILRRIGLLNNNGALELLGSRGWSMPLR